MDLAGTGRNFFWSTLATIVTLLGSAFLVAYNIRRLGRAEYGAVVTIGAALSVLTLFSGALRYAVVRSAASPKSDRTSEPGGIGDRDAIQSAHALFVSASIGLVLLSIGLGWLIPLDLNLRGGPATEIYYACVIFAVGSAIPISVTAFGGVLTGQERFRLMAQIGVVGFAVQLALTVALAAPLKAVGLALGSLGGGLVQGGAFYYFGRQRARWLRILPRRPRREVVIPVVRYAGGIAVLSLTATICSASDAFVIGGVRGGTAVTVFQVGAMGPLSLVNLLYFAFGVLFPRLVRSGSTSVQEEGIGWMGRLVGWVGGLAFASLGLLGPDLVRLFLSRPTPQATEILWICSAALCLDVAYHGVVQVLLARGQQAIMVKVTWFELLMNLSATLLGVELFGPVGSAIALAITIVTMDIVWFPIVMRGRWGVPAGRFVISNGVLQSIVAGGLAVGLAILPILSTHGLLTHLALVAADVICVLLVGLAVLGGSGRSRLFSLARRGPTVGTDEVGPAVVA